MNDVLYFRKYELKNNLRIRYHYRLNQITNTFFDKEYRATYSRFCKREVMSGIKANMYISELIESGKPFWVGRFGHTELAFVYAYLEKELLNREENVEKKITALCNNAGFFPKDIEYGKRYAQKILDDCSEIDVHGMWPLYMEDYFITKYEKNSKLMKYIYLEPYALPQNNLGVLPWSHSLKGKKVLVIHPFADTITKQYENKREHIFSKKFKNADDILPLFELKTLKAVQTIAGTRDERFSTWFEALEWMVTECKKIDFDIAIIGCGAYGFPLAAEIKKMGKGAIQLCGATQLMFGILGSRWKTNKNIMNELVNDSWVYPSAAECVGNMEIVENACYW